MLRFNNIKTNCTGCAACYSVCPKKCISMQEDDEGFVYPIASNDCIECGLCEQVCPMVQDSINVNNVDVENKKIVAATNKDLKSWQRSSSGGGFSGICQSWGNNDTLVFGAAWTPELNVQHISVLGVDRISPLCKSKYISSLIGDSLIEVKQQLKKGKHVIFCGTPCQVAGLHRYLEISKINCENLLLLDFICHGVGSPKVFQAVIKLLGDCYGKKVRKYEFRNKLHRYEEDYITLVEFEDSTTIRIDRDPYTQLFLSRAALRPCCCVECKFRSFNRPGDITLADARGMSTYIKTYYDATRNYTHIIANTDKGIRTLQNLDEHMYVYPCSIEDVIRYNPLYSKNIHRDSCRDAFFVEFVNDTQKTIEKYTQKWDIHKYGIKRLIKLFFPKYLYNIMISKYVGRR